MPSRPAGLRLWAASSNGATTANTRIPTIAPAATGTVPSARDWRAPNGSSSERPNCCPPSTSTWSSPCPSPSPPLPSTTRKSSTTSSSALPPKPCSPLPPIPQRLGVATGFFAVLHTWGQNLHFHPHLHCVVPAGGLSADHERWIRGSRKFLFPVKVLSALFRRLFLAALEKAYAAGKLQFFGDLASPRAIQPLSPATWRPSRPANGWSTPRPPLADRNTCSSTSAAIPIASPFPTAASWRWKTARSPSSGRITATATNPK